MSAPGGRSSIGQGVCWWYAGWQVARNCDRVQPFTVNTIVIRATKLGARHMRTLILAIAGALLYASAVIAQAPVAAPDPRAEVQRTVVELFRAAAAGDAARYRSLCTTGYQRLEGGEVMDVSRAIASFTSKEGASRKRTDQLGFRSTRVVGGTASVIYTVTSRFEGDGRVEVRRFEESATLLRGGGVWRVSLMHSNPIESPPQVATASKPVIAPKGSLPPWAKELPVQPGESLKSIVDDGKDKQVVTFFQVTAVRTLEKATFISGTGYVEIKGGGTYFSGMNRAQDPFIELTIMAPDAPVFQGCRELLTADTLTQNAIAIGGDGYFTSMPGVKGRSLGIVRLDTVTRCDVVPRR